MTPVRWLIRLALLGLLLAALAAGREYALGVAGPRPGPTPVSVLEGRLLLERILEAQGAAAWRSAGPVRFVVEVAGGRGGGHRYSWTLDPVSRSADVLVDGPPGLPLRFDAASQRVGRADGSPLSAGMRRTFDTIVPSIAFWSLLPAALDDTAAVIWRLPDAGPAVARLAVRWPGKADWFLFEADPTTGRLLGVEFVDARFTTLVRWRGIYEGPVMIDGRPLPGAWRFGARSPLPRLLTGGRDLIVLRYRAIG